jgi:hypothetical protein
MLVPIEFQSNRGQIRANLDELAARDRQSAGEVGGQTVGRRRGRAGSAARGLRACRRRATGGGISAGGGRRAAESRPAVRTGVAGG